MKIDVAGGIGCVSGVQRLRNVSAVILHVGNCVWYLHQMYGAMTPAQSVIDAFVGVRYRRSTFHRNSLSFASVDIEREDNTEITAGLLKLSHSGMASLIKMGVP